MGFILDMQDLETPEAPATMMAERQRRWRRRLDHRVDRLPAAALQPQRRVADPLLNQLHSA